MNNNERSTKSEITLREAQVAKLLIQGMTRGSIHEWVNNKTSWDVSEVTIDRYIKGASAKILEVSYDNILFEKSLAYTRLNLLYNQAIISKQLRVALSIQQEINKLCNLYALEETTNHDVKIKIGFEDGN